MHSLFQTSDTSESEGLTLAAAVGTRNDSRGPFNVVVPFIYNSSLHLTASVNHTVTVELRRHS